MSTTLATRVNPIVQGTPRLLTIKAFPNERGEMEPAFVRLDGSGRTIRSVTRAVKLNPDPAMGECYFIGAFVGNKWNSKANCMPTADGYLKLAKSADYSLPTPPLMWEGRQVPNPYAITDATGLPTGGVARVVTLGRGDTGNVRAIDVTIFFNLKTYLLQDCLKKWKGKSDENPKGWGRLIPIAAVTREDKVKSWIIEDQRAGLALVMDLSSKEVIDLYHENANRSKFPERTALKMAQRNGIRAMLGGKSKIDQRTFEVLVTSWPMIDTQFDDIARSAELIALGQPTNNVTVETVAKEAEPEDDDIDPSMEHDDTDGLVPEEPPADDGGTGPQETGEPTKDDGAESLRAKIRDRIQQLGQASDAVAGVMAGQGFSGMKDFTEGNLDIGRLSKILSELDDAVLKQAKAKGRK